MRIIAVCLMFLCFGACNNGSKKQQQEDPNKGKTAFQYNESAGINSMDPAFAKDQANVWAVNQVFNGLVQMNEKLEISPCIAKSWKISNDGKIYTFFLRNDVYFHDHELFPAGKGRKVIASDFVNSFFRITDPEIASPGAWIFNNIDRTLESSYLGFVAKNDTTLQIFLQKPFPPFLGLLTMQYCSVIPFEIVEHFGKEFRIHPIGTGPFVFHEWKEGVKLVLHKNPNYFEKVGNIKLPYLDAVTVSFIYDKQSEFIEFVKGNLDFISGIDGRGSYKDDLLTKNGKLGDKYAGKFQLISEPYLNTEFIGILMDDNLELVKNSELRKKAIRQAINYGFDRKKLMTYLRNNVGMAATSGIIPYGMPSFDSALVKGYEYNPEKAARLLADAGFSNGRDFPEITIHTTDKRRDVFEFIQHQLMEIGIKVKLEVNPAATHRQMIAKSAINMFWQSWIADYPDAENYLTMFYSKNQSPAGPNNTHFKSLEYDKLYEQATQEGNEKVRYDLYRKMDKIILEESPVIPLYYDQVIRLFQNNISGLGSNPMNLLILKNVKKTNLQNQDEAIPPMGSDPKNPQAAFQIRKN